VLSPLFSCSRCSSLPVSGRGGEARAFMRCTHLSSIALCLGGAIEAAAPRAGAARHGGVRGSRARRASGWTLPEWQIDAAVASVRWLWCQEWLGGRRSASASRRGWRSDRGGVDGGAAKQPGQAGWWRSEGKPGESAGSVVGQPFVRPGLIQLPLSPLMMRRHPRRRLERPTAGRGLPAGTHAEDKGGRSARRAPSVRPPHLVRTWRRLVSTQQHGASALSLAMMR
jgi:hypothetical protein